jgi:hypothetical protein
MKISLVVAGFMALLVCPALAAEEFFVVQNEKGSCKVSNKGRWRKQADRDGRLRYGRGGEGS